jgi:hypothetical protein
MNVLSLFDGMSCGMLALERAGIKVDNYYASEVKKHAIQVSQHNYPNIVQVGDVRKLSYHDGYLSTETGTIYVGKIDLLIGGSPCQDFSICKAMDVVNRTGITGLEGDKSSLFYEYLRLRSEINPTHFLLENVRLSKSSKAELDDYLGVEGVLINSSLVSYQRRARYYWTNIPNLTIPEDRGISFQDYKETDDAIAGVRALNPKAKSWINMWSDGKGTNQQGSCANITHAEKIYCLTTKQDRSPNSGMIAHGDFCRFLTQRELEQAQTVPVGYTSCLSYYKAADVLGDGWTIEVIAHIFQGLKT